MNNTNPQLTTDRPRLLIISHVYPFPRKSGQQQRVYYKLKALRPHFHLTFLTVAPARQRSEIERQLRPLCDALILLPARYDGSVVRKLWQRAAGSFYSLRTGLKLSNYIIGRLELTPARLAARLQPQQYDCVLYEYWHAVESVSLFQKNGVPCLLDMHNVLWQSYERQLRAKSSLPGWWKTRALAQYKAREEQAWRAFDALIAINAAEEQYARTIAPAGMPIFYAPMGTDLSVWPYLRQPARPPRLAYYGGLGSPHNQQDALSCYEQVMPRIWREYPDAELWLVGSNPPPSLRALAQERRVTVTGFVEHVQEVLKTMTAVICPWSGTYGFRSRLIEVMALGVPVVASPDAVYGMKMEAGRGIFLEEELSRLAEATLALLRDAEFCRQQSQLARAQVEEKFSYKATYGQLATELLEFVRGEAVVRTR